MRPSFEVLILAAVACTGRDTALARVSVRDSAGIQIVENRPPATAEVLVAEVDLTIGVVEGDPEYTFGRLADIAIDHQGRFLVLDQQAQQLKVFDRDGQFVTTVGGPGEGPGQFTHGIASVAVSAGDSIFVADYLEGRIEVFGPGGDPARTVHLPPQVVIGTIPLGGGAILGRALRYWPDESGEFSTFDGLVWVGSEGQSFDTLFTFDYEQPDYGSVGEFRLPLIANTAFWDRLDDGRIAWSALDHDRVFIVSLSGQIGREVALHGWALHPVSERDRSAIVDYRNRGVRAAGREPGPLPETAVFPRILPAITSIHAAPGGGFWVQRMGDLSDAEPMEISTQTEWLGGPLWDVFDSEGAYLCTARVPARFRLARVVQGGAVGIQKDEMDVERVVRLRVGC